MTFEAMGLRASEYVRSRWEGQVCGVQVLVEYWPRVACPEGPTTYLMVNKTGRMYAGHLAAEAVAALVVEYARNRVAELAESYEKWRGILERVERAYATEEVGNGG